MTRLKVCTIIHFVVQTFTLKGENIMKVTLKSISGIPDAIESMFISKRTWTPELAEEIRRVCHEVLDYKGFIENNRMCSKESKDKFNDWMSKMCKMTARHITIGKFIDLSFTVEGLHRAGQDDVDSHAKRMDNRIIRNSTRLAKFGDEMSDFYKGKIISTDVALNKLGMPTPQSFEINGINYVKCTNGYVAEQYKDNPDVLRGLYMLSIPSTFVFRVNLVEWSHIYKERNENGNANPEVKEFAEESQKLLEKAVPFFTKELMLKIMN